MSLTGSYNPSNFLEKYSLQAYIRTVASKAGLEVQFTDSVQTPQVQGDKIKIPATGLMTANKDYTNILLNWVNTVAGQYRYNTDHDMVKEKAIDPQGSPLGALFNSIETNRITRQGVNEFLGDGVITSNYESSVSKDKVKEFKEVINNKELDDKTKGIIGSMLYYDAALKGEWSSSINQTLNKLDDEVTKSSCKPLKDYIERLKKNFLDEPNQLGDTREDSRKAYDYAKKIYEEVYELDAEQEEQRCQAEAQQKGEEGEQAEGEGTPSEGDGDSSEGQGEDGEKGEGRGKPLDKVFEELNGSFKSSHRPPPVNFETGGSGAHLELDPDDFNEDEFDLADADSICVIDYPRNRMAGAVRGARSEGISPDSEDARSRNYHKRLEEFAQRNNGTSLANSVRRLLEINSRARTVYGQKKGKLHNRSLHRVTVKDAPGYNERVFKNKIENFTLDTAVTVLIDYSGSMNGTKMENAIHSGYLLNEALARSLRIPLEILGFSDTMVPVHMIFKGHDDRVPGHNLRKYMCRGVQAMSENADGEAILWAYSRLKQRKERRKLLVVLSDGSPATHRMGITGFTRKVIKQIESDKRVEIYGVGIMDRNVKRFYNENQVINNPDELESALLTLIKRKIFTRR